MTAPAPVVAPVERPTGDGLSHALCVCQLDESVAQPVAMCGYVARSNRGHDCTSSCGCLRCAVCLDLFDLPCPLCGRL